jgi:SOS-response transcriptional repressor LexA
MITSLLSNNGDDAGAKPHNIPTNINWNAYAITASPDLCDLKVKMVSIEEYTQDTVDEIMSNLVTIIPKSAHAHNDEVNETDFIPVTQEANRAIQKIINDISSEEIQSYI